MYYIILIYHLKSWDTTFCQIWVAPLEFEHFNTVKLLNKGHPFCRAFVATIEGWPLLRGFI